MKKTNEVEIVDENDLLSIFKSEEDLRGTDMLKMSDFFNLPVEFLNRKICTGNDWEVCTNAEELISQIGPALKCGVDVSQMGILVADGSHFSQDIMEGLENGTYHIGISREVVGNFRPGIFDENEDFVKHFTLKKALNPAEILSDVSMMSILFSLGNIQSQLENVSEKMKYLVNLERRETFDVPFINAREEIIRASEAGDIDEKENFLESAEKELVRGLNSLYLEVEDLGKELAGKNFLSKLQDVDSKLFYLISDVRMIQMYVGMRAYLFNFRGKASQARRDLEEYRYHMRTWKEEKVEGSRYSLFELMHSYYPYEDADGKNFWLKEPGNILNAIDTYILILDQKNMDVFYLTEEGTSNE